MEYTSRSDSRLPLTRLEVAFVVDTTGSMKDDINAVRDSLFDIVDDIVKKTSELEIRFAIVSYRDHPPEDRTYVTDVFDFTDNVKDIHRRIGRLNPSEGGDTPEAVADGLADARRQLSWTRDAYKILLLVGDAPPHGRNYNSLGDDHWPDGCPEGLDPRDEVRKMKREHGTSFFLFACGCNPLVEESFRSIAEAIEGGKYYSLVEAHQLPAAILEILEGVSDLIESDRRVLDIYRANDGSFDIADAAAQLGMELREMKTSLSRLLELGKISRWPRGRPLSHDRLGVEVDLGDMPSAILPGRAFNYEVRAKNPSRTTVGIRIIISLVTSEGVSEVTNENHDIAPRSDRILKLRLTPMVDVPGKATIRVEVLYGSRSIETATYPVRIY